VGKIGLIDARNHVTITGSGRAETDPRLAGRPCPAFGAIDPGLLMPHVIHFNIFFSDLDHQVPEVTAVHTGVPFDTLFL